MTKKSTMKKTNLAQSAILGVLAVIVAVVAYKQIFLTSYVTSSLPKDSLTRTIESCVQENFAPKLLSSLKQDSLQQNFNVTNLFGKEMLNNVLRGISTNMIKTRIQNNYVSETKVLKISDLLGKNAEIRVTGLIEMVSTVPVIGEVQSKKDYLVVLFKEGNAYHFKGLSVKDEKESQWQEWSCAKNF